MANDRIFSLALQCFLIPAPCAYLELPLRVIPALLDVLENEGSAGGVTGSPPAEDISTVQKQQNVIQKVAASALIGTAAGKKCITLLTLKKRISHLFKVIFMLISRLKRSKSSDLGHTCNTSHE